MRKIKSSMLALLMAIIAVMPAVAANGNKSVKFTEIRNYYHNNDAPLPKNPLFTTRMAFLSHFSPAAFMGKGGQPTPIDFKHQSVIAIVLPETDRTAEISNVQLTSPAKGKLLLTYTAHYGARQSFTSQPIFLMAVDSKYRKASVDVKANVIEDPEVITTDYRNSHYINDSRHINISIDYPTTGSNIMMSSVQAYEAEILSRSAAAISYGFNKNPIPYNGSGADFDKMLNFYTNVLTDSMNKVDKENAAPDRPCSADINIIRTDETNKYVTYQASGYLYMGGAHGLSVDDGATFNKATGKRADIIKDTAAVAKFIAAKLPADVKEFNGNKSIPAPETPAFLKDGKVVFLYKTGEIAANAAGAITVTFWPYEIKDYLTEEGEKLTE